MSTKQVKLSTGEWPISEIRPDEWANFFIMHPTPERPYIEKEVLGGVMEKVTPPDDSILWDGHNHAMQRHNQEWLHFLWLLGLATVDVPDEWELPPEKAMAFGVKEGLRGRKLQYIQHHIIATDEDSVTVQAATNAVITKEERAAGGVPFPDSEGDEAGSVDTA